MTISLRHRPAALTAAAAVMLMLVAPSAFAGPPPSEDSETHRAQEHSQRLQPRTHFTTLMTYDMEVAGMAFNFDPEVQDTYVQAQRFPATPSMINFVSEAADMGFTIFGVTGRNDDQKDATVANLAKVGYTDFTADRFFTKWTGQGDSQQPDYVTCASEKCSTVEYKAGTRRHIEQDLGYDIVLNVVINGPI